MEILQILIVDTSKHPFISSQYLKCSICINRVSANHSLCDGGIHTPFQSLGTNHLIQYVFHLSLVIILKKGYLLQMV